VITKKYLDNGMNPYLSNDKVKEIKTRKREKNVK